MNYGWWKDPGCLNALSVVLTDFSLDISYLAQYGVDLIVCLSEGVVSHHYVGVFLVTSVRALVTVAIVLNGSEVGCLDRLQLLRAIVRIPSLIDSILNGIVSL